MKRSKRRGFTLIELLVVVAIIALLIAILLPALGKAKVNALRTKCAATLKGWGAATYTYAQEYNGYFGAKPAGGNYGSQWDQDPAAYGIPTGPSNVPDPIAANGTSGATHAVVDSIYGNEMGHVVGSKARFCPADSGLIMGSNGVAPNAAVFYYGNRPLPGYRYVTYKHPATATAGPSGAPSLFQKIGIFKNVSNVAVMADAATSNNYGDMFDFITINKVTAGPGAGTVWEGLNNNAAVAAPRNFNGQGWNTQQELQDRHKGYGGVLFLDGHADIVPYSDYLKNIPFDNNDLDTTKVWTLLPN